MWCANLVDIDLNIGVALKQRASGTSMVKVNMGEQQRPQIFDLKAIGG